MLTESSSKSAEIQYRTKECMEKRIELNDILLHACSGSGSG
jgi:hypothetical protein